MSVKKFKIDDIVFYQPFNNDDSVNSEILKKYSDPEKTKKWLTKTFERLVTNHSELPNMESYIDSMIVKSDDPELNGTIDEKTYMNLYARLLYDSYSKADGVTNIIIIDTKIRYYSPYDYCNWRRGFHRYKSCAIFNRIR